MKNVDINLTKWLPPQWVEKIKKLQFSGKEQQGFLEDVAVLVSDGVPPAYAVEMVGRIAKKGVVKEVAAHIVQKIAEGKMLADGMEAWFPVPIVEMIRAGERGGTLADTLEFASRTLGQSNSVMASFISGLIYPIVVIIMGSGVCVFVNKSVFKQFESIKPVSEWPSNGQDLVVLANFIEDWWWIVILAIVGTIIGMARFYRNYTGRFRFTVDHLPLLSIYRRLVAARFMETLGMLVANGIAFKQAIKIVQFNTTPYLTSHLVQMEYKLGSGKLNIAEVLDTGLIDEGDVLRLQAVANAKGVEQALIRLGKHATEQGEKTIKLTGKILGGILLALGGGLAAFMVMAIYAVGSSLAG
ncbi:MAG: type II secretion system F family protein [Gammaproteobacteria bacterium]|nr:type II secretion system F family protein [Gammaproteobacteria bacterium]